MEALQQIIDLWTDGSNGLGAESQQSVDFWIAGLGAILLMMGGIFFGIMDIKNRRPKGLDLALAIVGYAAFTIVMPMFVIVGALGYVWLAVALFGGLVLFLVCISLVYKAYHRKDKRRKTRKQKV